MRARAAAGVLVAHRRLARVCNDIVHDAADSVEEYVMLKVRVKIKKPRGGMKTVANAVTEASGKPLERCAELVRNLAVESMPLGGGTLGPRGGKVHIP